MKEHKQEEFSDNLKQLLRVCNLENFYGYFTFHHLGIASKNIEEDIKDYQQIGYETRDSYIDRNLGVKGQFLIHPRYPRLEILENIPNSNSLDVYLNNFVKIFHCGYLVDDFQYCFNFLINKLCAKCISDIKNSLYFNKRSCYILLPDRFIIEIIEK